MKTLFVGAALALLTIGPGVAQERGTVANAVLGGSFFPFARAIGPKASPRCQRIADRMRAKRDDNILNPIDFRRLRSVGCQDVRPYD